MPRAPLSEQEIEAFRTRAVAAATHLFAEHGYEAVTMRTLAKSLGVSAMTPYRYFDNKSALFAQVRTEAFRRFADAQRDAVANDQAPMVSLLGLERAYIQFALDEPDAYRIMFELRQAPAGTYPELDAESARAFSYLHGAVKLAVAQKVLPGDPLTVAHTLWAHTHGIVSLHLAGKLGMGRDLEELCLSRLLQLGGALPHEES